jgi:hypothetical protein
MMFLLKEISIQTAHSRKDYHARAQREGGLLQVKEGGLGVYPSLLTLDLIFLPSRIV